MGEGRQGAFGARARGVEVGSPAQGEEAPTRTSQGGWRPGSPARLDPGAPAILPRDLCFPSPASPLPSSSGSRGTRCPPAGPRTSKGPHDWTREGVGSRSLPTTPRHQATVIPPPDTPSERGAPLAHSPLTHRPRGKGARRLSGRRSCSGRNRRAAVGSSCRAAGSCQGQERGRPQVRELRPRQESERPPSQSSYLPKGASWYF